MQITVDMTSVSLAALGGFGACLLSYIWGTTSGDTAWRLCATMFVAFMGASTSIAMDRFVGKEHGPLLFQLSGYALICGVLCLMALLWIDGYDVEKRVARFAATAFLGWFLGIAALLIIRWGTPQILSKSTSS